MYSGARFHWKRLPGLLVMQREARLPPDRGNIPVERAFQSCFFQQNRVKRLRKSPDVIQGRLRDLLHFLQIVAQRRSFRDVFAGTAQHRPDRGQDLPEFIVELAGNVAQRRFLRGDQFLRQLAALFGKLRQARKNLANTANQIQARQNDSDESRREEEIELALHAIVNMRNPYRGLLLAFVVFHQQPGNGCAERLLASPNMRFTASQNCATDWVRYRRWSGVRFAPAKFSSSFRPLSKSW